MPGHRADLQEGAADPNHDVEPAVVEPAAEDPKLLRPLRVETQHAAACLQAGETSLQEVDAARHRGQVNAFRGRATLHVGDVTLQQEPEVLHRLVTVCPCEHPGMDQRTERGPVRGAAEVVLDGPGDRLRLQGVAE